MAAFSRRGLSASTNGRPVGVVATSSPGTAIHSTGSTATAIADSVYLYVTNHATVARQLRLEWGSTSTTDSITQTIPPQEGAVKIADGWQIEGAATVAAVATATAGLSVLGYVNRWQ